jgi:hypothetical protein
MTKILCTGNPAHGGIAKSLYEYYENIYFVSLSSGYDLTTDRDFEKFIDVVKNYDVFINHSQIAYGMQLKLLEAVYQTWDQGHIVTIGSVLEFDEFQWLDTVTHSEKLELRNRSFELASEKIKTSYVITSGFQRHGPELDVKIHPTKIVETIDWILKSDLDIPLIFVDKIDDKRYYKWRNFNTLKNDT